MNSILLKKLNKIKKGEFGIFVFGDSLKEEEKELLIRELVRKYNAGIYVSFLLNLDDLRILMEKTGSETKIHIVGKLGMRMPGSQESVLSKGATLEEISILLFDLMNNKTYNFVVLDSFSMLLMHNNIDNVENFLNYFIEHNKLIKLVGIGQSEKSDLASLIISRVEKKIKFTAGIK